LRVPLYNTTFKTCLPCIFVRQVISICVPPYQIRSSKSRVIDEPVEFEKQRVEVQDFTEITHPFLDEPIEYTPMIDKEDWSDLGNTRILTGCAQNIPRTMCNGEGACVTYATLPESIYRVALIFKYETF
jgi:hypothetical protein